MGSAAPTAARATSLCRDLQYHTVPETKPTNDRIFREEQLRPIAMTTDREIKHVQFDRRAAVRPHLRIDAGFVVFQSFGKHFVNSPLLQVGQVEFRDYFRIKQRHSGVVTANHGVVLQRPFEIIEQRLDDEKHAGQNVQQRAATGSPLRGGDRSRSGAVRPDPLSRGGVGAN